VEWLKTIVFVASLPEEAVVHDLVSRPIVETNFECFVRRVVSMQALLEDASQLARPHPDRLVAVFGNDDKGWLHVQWLCGKGHYITLDILISQQRKVERFHVGISATRMLSFLRNRAA
jgi:hypothetical protein